LSWTLTICPKTTLDSADRAASGFAAGSTTAESFATGDRSPAGAAAAGPLGVVCAGVVEGCAPPIVWADAEDEAVIKPAAAIHRHDRNVVFLGS
jgi:hypothetical protein